jgi:hypothetical protein
MSPNEKRDRIKATVERCIPPLDEIDTTKVLSDEEQAEMARRFEEAKTNKELAKKLGREGLKAVLKEKFEQSVQQVQRLTQKFGPNDG